MERLEDIRVKLETAMEAYAAADICLAFSGGVDSSLLLRTAVDAVRKTGRRVYAVTFDSRLHPRCDLAVAARVAQELGAVHHIIAVDELAQEEIRSNPVDRCYLCKRALFRALQEFAVRMGADCVMDGTNEDDMHVYRPGIRALRELGVVSPLALLHIRKAEVKRLAAAYGISVAARPSAPCMATRLPYGTQIDYDILARLADGEEFLRGIIGGNVRLRLHDSVVRIEADAEALPVLLRERAGVIAALKNRGFTYITMDLEGFRSGSMDIGIPARAAQEIVL